MELKPPSYTDEVVNTQIIYKWKSMSNAGNFWNANAVSQYKNIFKIFIVKTSQNL